MLNANLLESSIALSLTITLVLTPNRHVDTCVSTRQKVLAKKTKSSNSVSNSKRIQSFSAWIWFHCDGQGNSLGHVPYLFVCCNCGNSKRNRTVYYGSDQLCQAAHDGDLVIMRQG